MIFRMRPIIPWCALSIPTADTSFTARRTTLSAWGWPLAARLYPRRSTCRRHRIGTRQVVRGGERHSIGAAKDQRPLERANTAITRQNANYLEILYSEDDRRIIPSNLGPPAVTALWSLASPILPPRHAPQNESHRQYSPSISSRSRSLPNGCAREARESPCLRWS